MLPVLRPACWLATVMAVCAASAACEDAAPDDLRFVVALDGDDAGPGTADQPFATLARARDAARELTATMESDIVIELRGGTYVLGATLALGDGDSGERDHRVIYQAWGYGTAEVETVVVSGGGALETLIAGAPGVHDVVLRALIFTDTAAPPVIGAASASVAFRGGRRITIEDNRFERLGGTALAFTDGSYEAILRRNVIGDVAGAGVEMAGTADPGDERNIVANNWIHDIGRAVPGAAGIAVAALEEVTVANNQVDHVPSSAIVALEGQERIRIIENLVFDAGLVLAGGGIHVDGAQGASWEAGAVVRGNVVHDTPVAILGEAVDRLTIQENVLYDNQHAVGGASPRRVRIFYTYWDDPEAAWTTPVGPIDVGPCPVLPRDTALQTCAADPACAGLLDRGGIEKLYRYLLDAP